MMRYISGLLLILVCFISSCNMCDKEHTYYLTDKTKSYFGNFSNGDMWIFINNIDSTFLDTLTLVNKSDILEFSFTETECDGDYFEVITYQLVSAKRNDTLSARLKAGPNIDIYSLRGIYNNHEIACYHDIDKNSGEYRYNSKDELNILQEYELNNIIYYDVVDIIFNQHSPSFPEEAPRYYHAKNIGIIEFEVYDELLNKRINYSIIQRIEIHETN